jgi:hypothetical protein
MSNRSGYKITNIHLRSREDDLNETSINSIHFYVESSLSEMIFVDGKYVGGMKYQISGCACLPPSCPSQTEQPLASLRIRENPHANSKSRLYDRDSRAPDLIPDDNDDTRLGGHMSHL